MSCFDHIIAVKDNCAGTIPASGYYIDELGIDLATLNDMVTPSYKDGEDLFSSKLEFARLLMVSQIRNHFSDKYKTHSIVDGGRMGFIQENLTQRSRDTHYRGIEIELCNNSTYLNFYLSQLELFLNYTGDLDVLVFDLLQGRQIDTISVTGIVAGEKKMVFPNNTYKSDRQKLHLFIGYDASAVDAYDVTVGTSGCTTCGSSGSVKLNDFVRVTSQYLGLADTPVDENLVGLGHTGGLSMIYSLDCNHDDWLCEKRALLALPLLYKTSAEILNHAVSEYDNIPSGVLIHRDTIKERAMDHEAKFIDHLNSVLLKLRLPKDNICFKCNPKSVHRTILP